MNSVILETLQDFTLDDWRPIVRRDLDLGDPLPPRRGNLVKVVTGMRRSGKSYRLFQQMDELYKSGVPWERMCYFNFEDARLAPVTPQTGDEVLECFYRLHPTALDEGAYLFLDELQEMEGWGTWLRRVVDTRKLTIYVSGSSSKMLSEDISTEFRGRAIDFELLPYSISEYARAIGTDIGDDSNNLSTRQRLARAALIETYLDRGGFPAAVNLPKPQATNLLQSYAQRVVARDVVERHDIAKPRLASMFVQRLLGSNAKPISIRKAQADLRSLGLVGSRELLGDILSYCQSAYLVFCVKQFSYTLNENSTSMPKVYAVDPGLAVANARANSNELGQRLEDAVYLELRRRMQGVRRDGICSYVTRGHGWEVDFVCGDALESQVFELIQVTASVEDETTMKRELRALWEALDETGLVEGTLVVLDGPEKTYERDGKRVRQVPAWRWFA